METIKVRITGTKPMLMHAPTLSDPVHPLTKEHKKVSGKKKKTDDDHLWLAKSDWRASLYYDEKEGAYLPGVNIEASIIAGAKLSKLGAAIKRGVEVLEDKCPLKYDGPKKPEAMWKAGMYDVRGVKVGMKRIMRYRPIFHKWSTEFTVMYDTEIMDDDMMMKCLHDAGAYCGVGDYRPKFGRFEVEVVK